MKLIDADKLINLTKEMQDDFADYVYDYLKDDPDNIRANGIIDLYDELVSEIEKQPIVSEKKEWNKLTFRPLTEDEKENYSAQEWTYMIDGLPDLGEEVLVTDGKRVWIDSFDIDDSVYLSGTDNEVDGVKAWMPLPKAYKGE